MFKISKDRIRAAAAIAGGLATSYMAHKQGQRLSFIEMQAIGGLGTLCGYVAASVITSGKSTRAKARL